jgi:N-acetylglucosamine-6-phosphate deacetylase
MRSVFTADRLWDGRKVVESPVIVVEDGRIASIASRKEAAIPAGELHAFPGLTLGPAFFDVHIHGSAGHDVMEATPEALLTIGNFLVKRGVGAYLATTVTAPIDATLRSLNGLAKLIEKAQEGAQEQITTWPIGIHLEGPFLSHAKRGVHPPDLLLAPQIDVFDRMFEAAEGHVRLMTLAPELPGAAELAAHATAKGVRVSVGHSNATAAETDPVLAAGATSATHTFNAMRPLDHREPGILGVVLTRDDLFAELICDGIHTAPELVRLWWKAKGAERAILITDGMAAAGMPDGQYMLGGFPVQVANGKAMANGVLAGSVLTLDRALTGATVENGLRLLGANPAAMTGFSDRAGSVAVGQPANLVAVDAAGRLVQAIHAGRIV